MNEDHQVVKMRNIFSQGDIVKLDFNPHMGHEQAGYRPALVISNNDFNHLTTMTIVSPITNTNNGFPLHIPLDERTETTGFIECEQTKSLDLNMRHAKFVEKAPVDIVERAKELIGISIK